MKESRVNEGFTLIEMVVVIAVIALVGVLIVTIFSRSLRGGNKTLAIGVIKQNGQSVLESMDKVVRNADSIICVHEPLLTTPATLVTARDGIYTKFRFTSETSTTNGFVQQISLTPGPDIETFINTVCTDPMPSQTISLTDTNTQTGVSLVHMKDSSGNTLSYFDRKQLAGFEDILTIQFALKPGIAAPDVISGQIDPVIFQTTVSLR